MCRLCVSPYVHCVGVYTVCVSVCTVCMCSVLGYVQGILSSEKLPLLCVVPDSRRSRGRRAFIWREADLTQLGQERTWQTPGWEDCQWFGQKNRGLNRTKAWNSRAYHTQALCCLFGPCVCLQSTRCWVKGHKRSKEFGEDLKMCKKD